MPDFPTVDVAAGDAPLDVLGIVAHPDDVELSAGGTFALLAAQGYRTGIVDLTRGELGTRGTPETRLAESAAAARVLGLAHRANLGGAADGLADGAIRTTTAAQRAIVAEVRRTRPRLAVLNAPDDRHPDHGDAARLAADALFYSGLARVETLGPDGRPQEPWRPSTVLHSMNTVEFEPTLVVDVTPVWATRLAALRAFATQFDAADDGPETFISTPAFLEFVEARARHYGYRIGATYGEPFLVRHGPFGVTDLVAAVGRERAVR